MRERLVLIAIAALGLGLAAVLGVARAQGWQHSAAPTLSLVLAAVSKLLETRNLLVWTAWRFR